MRATVYSLNNRVTFIRLIRNMMEVCKHRALARWLFKYKLTRRYSGDEARIVSSQHDREFAPLAHCSSTARRLSIISIY